MERSAYLRRRLLAGGAAVLLGVAAPGASSGVTPPLRAIYPGAASVGDVRAGYYLKLLELALQKSGAPFDLRPNGQIMVSPRVTSVIEADGAIDVTWGPSTRELEQRLLPVRVPIDKGILGWRLLLIRSAQRAAFAAVASREQLRARAAGQQRDWSDTAILRANGLKVVAATMYEPMFNMLATDRFQYFPRGVGEVWDEQARHAALGLEVERHLALHYPSVSYFFVGRHNRALGQAIERGLRAAIRDGSFAALFESCNGAAIARAQLSTRTVFELNNPLLSEAALAQWRDEAPLR
ncbi:hypothetical protein [Rugamonas sp.]|uniref:hypothetical protein n=1 Tax=Rugamonas sp. TaxID=1926287 RepID=UPI0025FEC765|nr:hypothetical protein [Rugamonas sp.]